MPTFSVIFSGSDAQGQSAAPAVSLPDKDKEPVTNNGFTPLGSRR